MSEGVQATGELEEILARLVAAGIEQPAALATLLGVEEVHIGRPRRALLRHGIVAADAIGALHVTPRGEAWLRLPAAHAPQTTAPVLDLPALEPLPPPLEPLAASGPRRRSTATRGGWPALDLQGPIRRLRIVRTRLSSVRLSIGRLPRGWPRPPRLFPRRWIALLGASALLVFVAGETGFYSFGRGGHAGELAAPVEARALATATPFAIAELPTPTPGAERWMVVQHTNGLGLVLRPAPASTARLLLLQDGARLRVTGESVEQAGHAWLPVTAANGTSGWVAGEFLAPAT